MKITITTSPSQETQIELLQTSDVSSAHAPVVVPIRPAAAASTKLPNPPSVFYRPKAPSEYKGFTLPKQKNIKIIHVTVVHPEDGSLSKDTTITLVGGYVKSLEPTSLNTHLQVDSSEWDIVDATGLYACPGLIDCHAHIIGGGALSGNAFLDQVEPRDSAILGATFSMRGYLARGFTTIRDVGGCTLSVAASSDAWLTPGPRILQGGAILSQTGGHGQTTDQSYMPGTGRTQSSNGLSWVVDGVPSALKATRELMRAGATHIKICTSGGVLSQTDKLTSLQFTLEEITAIVTAAEDMGATMVTAHCFTSEAIRRSIKGGIKGIEHGAFLDAPTAKLMAENNVFMIPTLAIVDLFLRVPEFGAILNSVQMEKMKMVGSAFWNAIKIAEENGVVVCYGTDLSGGVMSTYQTEEFVSRAAILPSPTVLKHATTNAAKLCDQVGLIGTIAPGAYADLILLKSNPLENVTILNEPQEYLKGVIKDGRCVLSHVDGLNVEVAL